MKIPKQVVITIAGDQSSQSAIASLLQQAIVHHGGYVTIKVDEHHKFSTEDLTSRLQKEIRGNTFLITSAVK